MVEQLREQGAHSVILLSHMGLKNDRKLADELQNIIPLIIGAHSHDLLPEGEHIGNVLIAQAGYNAQHLGYLDLLWDGTSLTIERVHVAGLFQSPKKKEKRASSCENRKIPKILGKRESTLDEPYHKRSHWATRSLH